MEILIQKLNTINISFSQDMIEGVDEITPFITSLQKLKKIINKPGFANGFNKTEKEVWNVLFEELLTEETGSPVVTHLSNSNAGHLED